MNHACWAAAILDIPIEDIPYPEINAGLNATCCILLVLGWWTIHRRLIALHKVCMLSALAVSALFLISYLFYHLVIRHGQETRFGDRAPGAAEWVKILYYGILLTHVLLAVVVTPMALIAATLGLRDRLSAHRWLGKWTMPIWLYVSVTGVVVYWMLYRLYPPS